MGGGEAGARAQHLARMVRPDLFARQRRHAHAFAQRALAPGLAGAEAVHVAGGQAGCHLPGRHRDQLAVLERSDAGGGQPVIQEHRVVPGREGMAEGGTQPFVRVQQPGQRRPVLGARSQGARQRDALAVLVQVHQHGHLARARADAHLQPVQQAIQDMGRIDLAAHQAVAHAGPGQLAAQLEPDPVLFIEAEHRGHHHRRAVGQGHEADAYRCPFRFVGAGDPRPALFAACHSVPFLRRRHQPSRSSTSISRCAISASFRFLFMAMLRRRW